MYINSLYLKFFEFNFATIFWNIGSITGSLWMAVVNVFFLIPSNILSKLKWNEVAQCVNIILPFINSVNGQTMVTAIESFEDWLRYDGMLDLCYMNTKAGSVKSTSSPQVMFFIIVSEWSDLNDRTILKINTKTETMDRPSKPNTFTPSWVYQQHQ